MKNKPSDFWQPTDLLHIQMTKTYRINLSNYASKTGVTNDIAKSFFFIAGNSLQSLAAVFPLNLGFPLTVLRDPLIQYTHSAITPRLSFLSD